MSQNEESLPDVRLWAALAAAQREFPAIGKDKENSHFKSRYADLATVIGATRDVLYRNGLVANHRIERTEDAQVVVVVAQLIHYPTGLREECCAAVPLSKLDAQGYKSAVTYAKRITYETILGLAPDDDDDGEAAVGRQASKKQQSVDAPPPRPQPPPPKEAVPFDDARGAIEAEIFEAASPIAIKRTLKRIEKSHELGEITMNDMRELMALADETARTKGIKPS